MAKYYAPEPDEWVSPIRNGYKMVCCDCGLVHDMDFRAVNLKYNRKKKMYEVHPIKKADVVFRVRRNTKAIYGHRKNHGIHVRTTG